ncbi:MAG: acetolactate synthase AlsS [Legionellaceae bacterium]|nr:acetolactate synthase AlsS [Legionellaceae bacterium]
MPQVTGARLLIQCLEAQGVQYIFGIPGAKIDAVFDALLDSNIQLITCRHEQNAAFIAGAYGRLTGKPGVVLVTSGPGVSNLTTGLLTATTEGDPIVAIGGNVPQSMILKHSHQGMNNVALMSSVTKQSVEIFSAHNIPEVVANAFRHAVAPRQGACFISLPQDVSSQLTQHKPLPNLSEPHYGTAPQTDITRAAYLMNHAKQPVLLLGMDASKPNNTQAIRSLLKHIPIAVISTYQAAGAISLDELDCFMGRVGLFKNQPGDDILDAADVVLCIGFCSVEYDTQIWNAKNNKNIIHIDYTASQLDETYHPICELLGDIAENIAQLQQLLKSRKNIHNIPQITQAQQALTNKIASGKNYSNTPIHPLRFIHELHQIIDDDTTICCDIGSIYMWMARYFLSFRPHQLLFSNGQQTLGVALPWAIACHYANPKGNIISMSGDGGFLFSAMELNTAVRENIKFVHFIWRDGTYNMVLEQERMKYHRESGVQLGQVNIPDFAKAFGAVGLELNHPDEFKSVYQQALASKKPVLIDVPIDYSDNPELFSAIDPKNGH